MIVTKEIAAKYILKRGCYLIQELPDGQLKIVHDRINWLEGMELFETLDECSAEVDKRLLLKRKPGDCPQCYNKGIIEASEEIKQLPLLPEKKFGTYYRCSRCQTVWFKGKSDKSFSSYDKSVADYLLDWANRDLKPSGNTSTILRELGNISNSKHEEVYLASIVLKSGVDHSCAMIILKGAPPDASWLDRKDLFFLDQVTEIKACPYAYPFSITKHAWKERQKGSFRFVYIKDSQTMEEFNFEAHVGLFMPPALSGREFALSTSNGSLGGKSRTIVEPHERGGSDQWSFLPPPKAVYVWGDLC